MNADAGMDKGGGVNENIVYGMYGFLRVWGFRNLKANACMKLELLRM
jgi:hypothetical protein